MISAPIKKKEIKNNWFKGFTQTQNFIYKDFQRLAYCTIFRNILTKIQTTKFYNKYILYTFFCKFFLEIVGQSQILMLICEKYQYHKNCKNELVKIQLILLKRKNYFCKKKSSLGIYFTSFMPFLCFGNT